MIRFDAQRRRTELRAIKQEVEDQLLALPGVNGIDIGEKLVDGRGTRRLAFVLSVHRKLPFARLPDSEVIPGSVHGVLTDVVQEGTVLHSVMRVAEELPRLRGSPVPRRVVGGISIGPCRTVSQVPPVVSVPQSYVVGGTLGALVVGRAADRRVMGITNFHVACVDDAWEVGDVMVRPARTAGGYAHDVVGTLARAALSGWVNAAAVELSADLSYGNAIAGIGAVSSCTKASVGDVVRKVGTGSGLTLGVVVSVDATLVVDYGPTLGTRAMREQIRIRAISGSFGVHGDAGAILVNAHGQAVGLYFGGDSTGEYGFANPIGNVLDELDVDMGAGASDGQPEWMDIAGESV